jgi:Dockerin type I domain
MFMRFAFVALISAFVFLWANVAVANTGNVLDVNKDGLIDDTDADIVILHINTYGSTNALNAALTQFGTWDDEDIPDLIDFLNSAEDVLYDLATINPTSGDEARVNYVVTWERKDVNGNGTISAADALAIINYLNS